MLEDRGRCTLVQQNGCDASEPSESYRRKSALVPALLLCSSIADVYPNMVVSELPESEVESGLSGDIAGAAHKT